MFFFTNQYSKSYVVKKGMKQENKKKINDMTDSSVLHPWDV